jgi:flagellar protein FlbD
MGWHALEPGTNRTTQGGLMIIVTTVDGQRLGVNPDLIRHVEAGTPTEVVLIDGTRYVVTNSLEEVADQLLAYRVAVVCGGQAGTPETSPEMTPKIGPDLHLVP